MLQRLSLLLLVASALSVGCSSAGTGGSESPSDPYTLDSLDEDCFGVTGREVLAAAQPSYAATFTYNEAEPNAGTTTALTLGIHYAGGEIVCHPALKSSPTGLEEGPHVTIDVAIAFDTADGAFREQTAGQLDGDGPVSAHLTADVRQSDLDGTYDPDMPGLHDISIGLDGSATATMTGTVMKSGVKPNNVAEVAFVGSW